MPSMPFGVHRGKPLRELPDEYVDWLVVQPWVQDWLREALVMELEIRRRVRTELEVQARVAKASKSSGDFR